MTRSIVAALLAVVSGFAGAALAGPTTKPTVVYADNATPSSPLSRSFDGSSWTPPVAGSSAAASIAWQSIANCPTRDELSLLSLNQSRALYVQTWDGTWWSGATQLAADCGVHTARVFACEYEQSSAQLLAVYRKANATSVYYRSYTSGSPAEQTFAMALDSAPMWMGLTPKPRSDEVVLLVATSTHLYAAVWNGAAWGNQVTLDTAVGTLGRPYACAYMNQAGKALVAWGATLGAPKYSVWDGTAWGAAANLPSVGGVARWLTMTGSPRASSDEVLVACINSSREVCVNTWNGTAWGSNLTVEATAASSIEGRVDVAYQPDGTNGMVVWHRANTNALRYRTWDGASWSAVQVGPDMGTETRHIQLTPGSNTGDIVMMVHRRATTLAMTDYTLYSQGGAVNQGTTVVEGLVGAQASLTLPAPPTNPAGSTNLSYGNNATATISPGAYGSLSVGNSCTLNFSAGTYVFTSFNSDKNSLTMNFNTSGGDVTFILTNGNFDAKNTLMAAPTGSGQVRFHVLNGNFDAELNTTMTFGSLMVYNGSISIGANTNIMGAIFATGNITVGSGAVIEPVTSVGSPGRLSAAFWSSGTPGSVTEVCAALPGSGRWECFALSTQTPLAALRISRWREVSQEE